MIRLFEWLDRRPRFVEWIERHQRLLSEDFDRRTLFGLTPAEVTDWTRSLVNLFGMYHLSNLWDMRVRQLVDAQDERETLLREHVAAVTAATTEVQATIQAMSDQTSRAQRLALWVGVAGALLGAILGGFAGAVAARIIG